jgi:hypothetical protein
VSTLVVSAWFALYFLIIPSSVDEEALFIVVCCFYLTTNKISLACGIFWRAD